MKQSIQALRNEQGFTLVELAVVMIIIGILIGGILKGQELITNARVTSTTSQLEALGAAKNDFQNQYNSLPGDMLAATTRLTGCGNPITSCGNGDGRGTIGTGAGAVIAPGAALTTTGEDTYFFGQLLAAGYITGMTGVTGAGAAFGATHPTTPLGGGFGVGQTLSGASGQLTGVATAVRPGVYLAVMGSTAATSATTALLTAPQANRIDTKLDDGLGRTGSIVSTTDATCQDGNGSYVGSTASNLCGLYSRI